ncbi:hypothetical protein H257_09468 [Aphanomyces astaci]|uniref:Uncharacterized protein n=1 Tax=Aphanomyces astaci TaxID=112090 RepID=W4GBW0_APHAT|nr:hypothetical protein H257_09468 [Aphanomyces astaci]ETV76448.1 hypothetical protein H257_09468 [Aphanomyces astaci]|eukprot:XP_009833993.1 hypothetical protein H257_09468 [Aphanomyces astaci]
MMADKGACPDGVMGCCNGCSKSNACTLAKAQGKTCLIVTMMYSFFNPGYLEAAIANNNIPAYFCFSGYDSMEAVTDVMNKNGTVTFYHCEPDLFHLKHEGKLQRIALSNVVATATSGFGERGYGNQTENPVNVDFTPEKLEKVLFQPAAPRSVARRLLDQVSARSSRHQLAAESTGHDWDGSEPNPSFTTACNWVKTNYMTWKAWLDPLPLCSFQGHMEHTVGGCDNSTPYSNVSFVWATPDPANAILPCQLRGRDGESAATNAHESVLRLARRQRPPVVALARYETAL